MSEALLRSYLKNIEQTYRNGIATEHSYRSDIKLLLEALSPGITATNEPKRVKCGAPDFIITNKHIPLGYIETKDIGISLANVEHSDQMKRYLASLANLILTDYVEFRWYVSGSHRMTARLAKVGAKGKWQPEPDGIEQVSKLLQGFLVTHAPTINNPKELATRMAALAQLIRNTITQTFKSEEGAGSLHSQMEGFRQVLLPDLAAEQFADMYAQTISYGLFAARCNIQTGITFTREHAAFDIPKTNPFLRKMFGYIAGPDLDERIVWAVDDLAEVLNRTDMEAILHDFGKHTRQEDPVVHFYETFLAAYDPKMREARGVYYTPEPVVSYIVRSVDYLLKNDFGLPDGLADATKIKATSPDGTHSLETHKVQILDPATGTGTFLHSVIDLIYETFKGNKGMWSAYVSQHLLPRLFGFELLMAPYAVAHMKLGLQLAETGYDFKSSERLGVYLTNTLEEGFQGGKLPFAEWIVEEANSASNVKYDAPVMVVIGNPPYSGHSANKGSWITNLLHDKSGNYFEVDGQPLGEQNPKYLLDDYVKFIRFAQWRIERTGYGIIAFITNHGYLNNPTFRGMRQSLMRSFDEIYILDIHGDSKKKERVPDGSKDENVFDIQQGVAIGIFVKRPANAASAYLAIVRHAHLWGPREVYLKTGQKHYLVGGKYHWLTEHNITTTEWKTLKPQSPFYLFIPQNMDLQAEYAKNWKITDIFPLSSTGIKTHRDHFVLDFDDSALQRRIEDFRDLKLTDQEIAEKYELKNTRDWKLDINRRSLAANPKWNTYFTQSLYRPFDFRPYYHHENVVELPRSEVMRHFTGKHNVGLLVNRQIRIEEINHFWVTNLPTDFHALETAHASVSVLPLYLYPIPNKNSLFDINLSSSTPEGRHPNLSPNFIAIMERNLEMRFITDSKANQYGTVRPEDVLNYIYAIFNSPTYRSRYGEFLKIDFPRLPLTSNPDLFRTLCKLGERLVALHLMEQFSTNLPMYPIDGNHMVEKVEYLVRADQPAQGRIYINKTQYFDNVPQNVWQFHVGGYQVCHKWLKDRKGRILSFEDIRHYQRTVAALAETIALMSKIDEVIEEHGGWPIA